MKDIVIAALKLNMNLTLGRIIASFFRVTNFVFYFLSLFAA